jgi:hypothetical protein
VAKVKISFDEEATKFYYGFEYEALAFKKNPVNTYKSQGR